MRVTREARLRAAALILLELALVGLLAGCAARTTPPARYEETILDLDDVDLWPEDRPGQGWGCPR